MERKLRKRAMLVATNAVMWNFLGLYQGLDILDEWVYKPRKIGIQPILEPGGDV